MDLDKVVKRAKAIADSSAEAYSWYIPGYGGEAGRGKTMKQWYIGMALIGLCANPQTLELSDAEIGKRAVELADATIVAEAQKGEQVE